MDKSKKNKKKKGKQAAAAKTSENLKPPTTATEETTSASGEQQHNRVCSDEPSNGTHVSQANAEPDRVQNDSANCVIQDEKVKQLENENNICNQREAILEEKIKQLEVEKNSCNHKEAILEEKVKQLEFEKNSYIHKQVILQEKVKQLQTEKCLCIEREVSLEEKVKQLEIEKSSLVHAKANLEKRIMDLENERISWLQKEAMEENTKQLLNEKPVGILKEKSSNETIARLSEDNMEVQLEVKLLQESRDGLLQENHRLMETTSILQSKIEHLEKESSVIASSAIRTEKAHPLRDDEVANAQIEAACALVDKLITENAELVEKVNELFIKLHRLNASVDHSPEVPDQIMMMSETARVNNGMPEIGGKLSESVERMESPALIQTKDSSFSLDNPNGQRIIAERINEENPQGSYSAGETEEIVVQIPLDESDTGEVELHSKESNEKSDVPLSHAPLTGAPFRMISFVARYVSGADLVNKSMPNPGR